jgi:peptidoglycan/LPS O-acetylase OafA/YrhL
MTMRTGEHGARLRGLDALRGIAAMAVVVFHYTTSFDSENYFPGYDEALLSFPGGRYGVWLFFVISGFVILWSVQRAPTVGDFAYSRFSRLYPPYWGSLLFVAAYIVIAQNVLDAGIDKLTFTLPQFLANLTMVPSWFGQKELDGAYWTLAIEMGFYVLIAILHAFRLTRPDRIVRTIVVLWIFDTVVLSVVAVGSGQGLESLEDDWLGLFIAGMALFTLYQRPQEQRWIKLLVICSLPLVSLSRGSVVAALVTAGAIAAVYVAVSFRVPLLESRPLLWLGTLSYSIYLVHAYPGYITIKLLLDAGWDRNLAVLVALAQTFVLALALHHGVEKPVTRWLRHRRSRPARQASVASA